MHDVYWATQVNEAGLTRVDVGVGEAEGDVHRQAR